MNRWSLAALAALTGVVLAARPASAQHAAQHDDEFAADMQVVHQLLSAHEAITRTVTKLPNGVRTVTESADPGVAAYIKGHVASMNQRLMDGKVFNVTSSAIPTIFENADRIQTEIEETPTGVVFTQTTEDPELVAVLQAHAEEVSELARDGMAAMMRNMMEQGGRMMEHGGAMPHRDAGVHQGSGVQPHDGP